MLIGRAAGEKIHTVVAVLWAGRVCGESKFKPSFAYGNAIAMRIMHNVRYISILRFASCHTVHVHSKACFKAAMTLRPGSGSHCSDCTHAHALLIVRSLTSTVCD